MFPYESVKLSAALITEYETCHVIIVDRVHEKSTTELNAFESIGTYMWLDGVLENSK